MDRGDRGKVKMILLCHADDLLAAGSVTDVDALEKHLNRFFETNLSGSSCDTADILLSKTRTEWKLDDPPEFLCGDGGTL